MQNIYEIIENVADPRRTFLISASRTGKEVIANAVLTRVGGQTNVHQGELIGLTERPDRVAIVWYIKGSFKVRTRIRWLYRPAHGGSLSSTQIGEMPPICSRKLTGFCRRRSTTASGATSRRKRPFDSSLKRTVTVRIDQRRQPS